MKLLNKNKLIVSVKNKKQIRDLVLKELLAAEEKKKYQPDDNSVYYVVCCHEDNEFYLTHEPDEEDQILFRTRSKFKAESRLNLELQRSQ